MGKYLIIGRYDTEGAKGLIAGGGSARREAVTALAESVGGSIESLYFAFGEDDVFVICDMPSDEAAAAIGLTVGASGSVSLRTVALLTPEQIDAAAALSPAYTPPGG
jgi:uncharacterized protein with GYD domain